MEKLKLWFLKRKPTYKMTNNGKMNILRPTRMKKKFSATGSFFVLDSNIGASSPQTGLRKHPKWLLRVNDLYWNNEKNTFSQDLTHGDGHSISIKQVITKQKSSHNGDGSFFARAKMYETKMERPSTTNAQDDSTWSERQVMEKWKKYIFTGPYSEI